MSLIEDPLTENSNHVSELMDQVLSRLDSLGAADNIQMIEDTIKVAREAYALTTENSADRIVTCLLLAASLGRRFECYRDDGLLEEIIMLEREVLALASEEYLDRATSCKNLAIALKTRYKHTGDMCFLDEAIDLQREALDLCPVGHPNRSSSCGNLATLLWTRYEHMGDVDLLDKAIDLQHEALGLCPKGQPDRAMSCENLAISLVTRYRRTGDVDLLDKAIDLQREALDLRPVGHPDRSSSCGNLARSLKIRYKCTGDIGLLDEVVDLDREALDLRPVGHPDRFTSFGNLATSLITRYEYTGDAGLVDEAISLEREALSLCSVGHPDRFTSCGNLATALQTRYNHTGDMSLLDKAIDLQREALDLCPARHPDRSLYCVNLSTSLWTRYGHMGDVGFLDKAIDLQREALGLCPKGQPDRAMSCGNLATLLFTQYRHTGDVGLLNEAIDLEREALDLCPAGHPDRPWSCRNLARSLSKRYKNTGDISLLDEAINMEREALDLCPTGHIDRSSCCANLAISLETRYEHMGDVDLLDSAIDLQREALDLCPAGHPGRSVSCANLAVSLIKGYEYTGDVGFLEKAIDLQREALDLCPAGHPDRSMSCGNLAATLWIQYKRTGDTGLLDKAIDLDRQELGLRPAGHPSRRVSCENSANSLSTRYEHTGNDTLFYESLTLSQKAVTIAPKQAKWKHLHHLTEMHMQNTSPSYDMSKAILCISQSFEHDPDDTLAFVKSLSYLLDKLWIYDMDGKYIQLITIYQRLINLLPLLVHPALGLQPQLQALKRCTRLGSDAFINAALADNHAVGLETLELAQGVIWSQSLHRRDPQLKDVPEHLASELQDLLQSFAVGSDAQLANEERKWLTPRDILHAQSSRAYAVIQEIRALPGLDRFMLGKTFETLLAVAFDHPVIVLVGARGRHYALILDPSFDRGHDIIELNISIEDWKNLSLASSTMSAHRRAAVREEKPEEGDRASHKKTGRSTSGPRDGQLKTLWHKVVKPVLNCLGLKSSRGQDRPRLHWCSTGAFSNLPLHAAGIHGGSQKICCSDFVVSSYTPTITGLLRAQQTMAPVKRRNISLALVAEKRALQRNLELIPGVDKEAEHVAAAANLCSVKVLHQWVGSTTLADTVTIIQRASIVHLACHGIQDPRDATQSGFCLGDGRLTIAKLMELELDNAFLAFLSACETAKGDKDQPDQAMHLAAAMLFSGFKSVVATMWAISDLDGPKVAQWFYEELLSREVVDANSVAYALDYAVVKLRDSGLSPERWAPFIHMGA